MHQKLQLSFWTVLSAVYQLSLSHYETAPVPPTRGGKPRAVLPYCLRRECRRCNLRAPLLPARPRDKACTISCFFLMCRCAVPVAAAKARDGCVGFRRGDGIANEGYATGRLCNCCCRWRGDLCGRRTRGWTRHARLLFVAIVSNFVHVPLEHLSLPAAGTYPGRRLPF